MSRNTRKAKYGGLLHHEQEAPFIERDDLCGCAGPHCRAARTTVDKGHFAHYAARPHSFEHAVAVDDLQFPGPHDKSLVGRVAFGEQNLSRIEAQTIFIPEKPRKSSSDIVPYPARENNHSKPAAGYQSHATVSYMTLASPDCRDGVGTPRPSLENDSALQ